MNTAGNAPAPGAGPRAGVTRMDMHVHSSASRKPVFAFLSPLGCPESYSAPERVYDQARSRGMDLVTITDHDTIDGVMQLVDRGFQDVIVGEEVTVFFPEDRCKLHVLVWSLTPDQHEQIETLGLRDDVYQFAAWLAEHQLAHALAHPLYIQNGRLGTWHLERASLLFKGFETINGAHAGPHRSALLTWLDALTPARVQELIDRHQIEPLWSRIWLKAVTGGSDDHALLNIGRTWTSVTDPGGRQILDPAEFLQHVMAGRAAVAGQVGHGALLAHQLMAIGFEYYTRNWHHHTGALGRRAGREIVRFAGVEASKPASMATAAALVKRALSRRRLPPILDALRREVEPLLDEYPDLRDAIRDPTGAGGPALANHERMAEFTDDLAERLTRAMASDALSAARRLDRDAIVDAIISYGALLAMQAPHVFSLFHQNKERALLRQIRARSRRPGATETEPMKVMLFTDTLGDVNGVCRFIQNMGTEAAAAGRSLQIVTSTRMPVPDAAHITNHKPVYARAMPGYQGLEIVLPPMLRMLREADRFQPDVIHISTPGSVGLVGLVAAKMLRTPIVGVYHTDFPAYIDHLFRDEVYSGITGAYMGFFYSFFRTVLTRSEDYIESLMELGLSRDGMQRLRPGVDLSKFGPEHADRSIWPSYGASSDRVKVLYCGRVSVEKNLPMLTSLWPGLRRACAQRGIEVELVVVGDGPYRAQMERELAGEGCVFTSIRRGAELSALYASSDLFAFPSDTDTLGQVVLESQASGLPVVVSNQGGPKEVVDHAISGFVVPAGNLAAWRDAIVRLVTDADLRTRMGDAAQAVAARYSLTGCFEQFWETHEEAHRVDYRQSARAVARPPKARSVSVQ